MNCAETPAAAGRNAWERWAAGLLGIYVALIAGATVLVALDMDTAWLRALAVALGLAWEATLVRAFVRMSRAARDQRWPRAAPYLVAMLLFWAGLLWLSSSAFVATAVILGIAWPLADTLPAILFAVVAAVVAAAREAVAEHGLDAGTVVGWGASLATAVLLGVWVSGIISQSRERARLLGELERAQQDLAVSERAAGVLAERDRLAAEIHDTLAQGFASVVLQMEAARAALPPSAADAHRHLELARRTAAENLQEARGLVAALTPPALATGSLPDALDRLVGQVDGPAASLAVEGVPGPLPPADEVTLLRVAQEAITNAVRHAGARTVAVRLAYRPDAVTVSVRDDGVGFSPDSGAACEAAADGGFGLAGMRRRVEQQAGQLRVQSAPGAGTTLTVQLPRLAADADHPKVLAARS